MMLTSGLNNILSVIRGLPGAATDGLVAGFGGEFRDSQAFADAFEQALQLEPQLPGEANTASAFELLQSLLEEGNPLPPGGNPSPFNSDAAEAGLSVDAATRAIPSNLSGASVAGTDLFSEGAVSDAEAARKLADLFEQRSLGSKASVASATAEPIPPTGEAANATPGRNSEASDEALSALLAKRLTAATEHTYGGKTNSTAAASFAATSANTANETSGRATTLTSFDTVAARGPLPSSPLQSGDAGFAVKNAGMDSAAPFASATMGERASGRFTLERSGNAATSEVTTASVDNDLADTVTPKLGEPLLARSGIRRNDASAGTGTAVTSRRDVSATSSLQALAAENAVTADERSALFRQPLSIAGNPSSHASQWQHERAESSPLTKAFGNAQSEGVVFNGAEETANPSNKLQESFASATGEDVLDALRNTERSSLSDSARSDLAEGPEQTKTPLPKGSDTQWSGGLASSNVGLSGASRTASALPSAADVFTDSLQHSPDAPEFPEEVISRVRLLQHNGRHEIRLNLHPAELGRMSISVTTDSEGARVSFAVDNPHAREAIEAAMPRLRELLEDAGLQLADSNVSQEQQFSGENRSFERADRVATATAESPQDDLPLTETAARPDNGPEGLVDAYV